MYKGVHARKLRDKQAPYESSSFTGAWQQVDIIAGFEYNPRWPYSSGDPILIEPGLKGF